MTDDSHEIGRGKFSTAARSWTRTMLEHGYVDAEDLAPLDPSPLPHAVAVAERAAHRLYRLVVEDQPESGVWVDEEVDRAVAWQRCVWERASALEMLVGSVTVRTDLTVEEEAAVARVRAAFGDITYTYGLVRPGYVLDGWDYFGDLPDHLKVNTRSAGGIDQAKRRLHAAKDLPLEQRSAAVADALLCVRVNALGLVQWVTDRVDAMRTSLSPTVKIGGEIRSRKHRAWVEQAGVRRECSLTYEAVKVLRAFVKGRTQECSRQAKYRLTKALPELKPYLQATGEVVAEKRNAKYELLPGPVIEDQSSSK